MLDSFTNSIVFSAGIGQGIYFETEVLDLIGIGIGMYGNYGVITYEDGRWETGQELYSGISGTLLKQEFGFAENQYRPSGGDIEFTSFCGINTEQESLPIWGFGVYVIVGFSVYVGFDTISFCEDIDKIFFS